MVALKGEKSGPPGSGMCCRRLTTSLPCERTRAGGREKQRSRGDVCAKQGGGHAGESRRFGICCNRGCQCPHRLCQIGGMGTAGVMRRRRGQSRSSGFAEVDLQRGLRLRALCGPSAQPKADVQGDISRAAAACTRAQTSSLMLYRQTPDSKVAKAGSDFACASTRSMNRGPCRERRSSTGPAARTPKWYFPLGSCNAVNIASQASSGSSSTAQRNS